MPKCVRMRVISREDMDNEYFCNLCVLKGLKPIVGFDKHILALAGQWDITLPKYSSVMSVKKNGRFLKIKILVNKNGVYKELCSYDYVVKDENDAAKAIADVMHEDLPWREICDDDECSERVYADVLIVARRGSSIVMKSNITVSSDEVDEVAKTIARAVYRFEEAGSKVEALRLIKHGPIELIEIAPMTYLVKGLNYWELKNVYGVTEIHPAKDGYIVYALDSRAIRDAVTKKIILYEHVTKATNLAVKMYGRIAAWGAKLLAKAGLRPNPALAVVLGYIAARAEPSPLEGSPLKNANWPVIVDQETKSYIVTGEGHKAKVPISDVIKALARISKEKLLPPYMDRYMLEVVARDFNIPEHELLSRLSKEKELIEYTFNRLTV